MIYMPYGGKLVQHLPNVISNCFVAWTLKRVYCRPERDEVKTVYRTHREHENLFLISGIPYKRKNVLAYTIIEIKHCYNFHYK